MTTRIIRELRFYFILFKGPEMLKGTADPLALI